MCMSGLLALQRSAVDRPYAHALDSVRAPPHAAGRLCRVLQACMAASSRRRVSHKPVAFDDRQLQTLAAAAAAHFSQAPLRNLVA